MSSDDQSKDSNRIPIRFLDAEADPSAEEGTENRDSYSSAEELDDDSVEMIPEEDTYTTLDDLREDVLGEAELDPSAGGSAEAGGPEIAELVATRAELKRVEVEIHDLRDRLARRQADFENFRKRIEKERAETYNRAVADIAAKLLPVLDNLGRALDAEATVESGESDEFRHFLSGVDLIYKQLNGVIDALGVKPVAAVGEPFDPHFHEAVVTEPTDEYEPDTVVQEIVRGYRMGDKLIRPALVKVAVKK
jgi:molecular chaperone GrpE